jgi:hypothetical protein
MKNIQVIDGAVNCVYDIFAATDDEFNLIFSDGTNIAFIEDVYARENEELLTNAFNKIWTRPIRKAEANGINGLLFYGLTEKKKYYPTLRDEEAINPDGSALRRQKP